MKWRQSPASINIVADESSGKRTLPIATKLASASLAPSAIEALPQMQNEQDGIPLIRLANKAAEAHRGAQPTFAFQWAVKPKPETRSTATSATCSAPTILKAQFGPNVEVTSKRKNPAMGPDNPRFPTARIFLFAVHRRQARFSSCLPDFALLHATKWEFYFVKNIQRHQRQKVTPITIWI
jgi:hypothetical protein